MYKLIRKDGQKYTFDYDGVEVTTSGKVVFIKNDILKGVAQMICLEL